MIQGINYRIFPANPQAHIYRVTCVITDPSAGGQVVRMPTWSPGSYLIREFARNIVEFRADSRGTRIDAKKIAKNAWQCSPCNGPLRLTYDIYAWDLSVRAAYLDSNQGFFNGPSVFIYPEDKLDHPCELEIVPPEGSAFADWEIATSLASGGAAECGFGRYVAASYDELIDHPVAMGRFTVAHFEAGNATHRIAILGRHRCDLSRLTRDLKSICQWQIDLFGAALNSQAPMQSYLFMILSVGEGYGGLEHRASTTLLCSRHTLPTIERPGMDEDYKTFLGLASHEYFHAWNVKRIKPLAFSPYDFGNECYTTLLWAFEGITSYYDDLALLKCGLINIDDYLELVARTITSVSRGSGRLKQSVAESSFDAWIKYYRADENAPNAIVSYYAKGSLVALLIDLTLRLRSTVTLNDLMRALWNQYGKPAAGLPEDGIREALEAISKVDFTDFFSRYVYGTDELPLERLLKEFGVVMQRRPAENATDKGGKPGTGASPKPTLGAKVAVGQEARLVEVYDGGAAQRCGLTAGDLIVAADELRVTNNLEGLIAGRTAGTTIKIHAFRRDELMVFDLPISIAPADTCWLAIDPNADAVCIARRESWLGKDPTF